MTLGILGFVVLACLPETERFDTAAPEPPPTARDTESYLSASLSHTCALPGNGGTVCWGTSEGDWNYGQVNQAPEEGSFVQIGAGGYFSCALEDEGAIQCWGQEIDVSELPLLRSLNVGVDHLCGLDGEGAAYCVGTNAHGQLAVPEGKYKQISAGYGHTCALKSNGKAECWGNDERGQASPPNNTFSHISSGAFQTCGIDADTLAIFCWGNEDEALEALSDPPTGSFTAVSASRTGSHACGIKETGEGVCWGLNDMGQAPSSIAGTLSHISAGSLHTCVTTTSGNWNCYGQDTYGEATPPG